MLIFGSKRAHRREEDLGGASIFKGLLPLFQNVFEEEKEKGVALLEEKPSFHRSKEEKRADPPFCRRSQESLRNKKSAVRSLRKGASSGLYLKKVSWC